MAAKKVLLFFKKMLDKSGNLCYTQIVPREKKKGGNHNV